MHSIASLIRASGHFLRRRDLRARGFGDGAIRAALAAHDIFRVRQGWYSVPDTDDRAVMAVRVGGRLTSISALESYGIPVPRSATLHVAVPATGSRLRSPTDRRTRLGGENVHVHWNDSRRGGDSWRVSIDDALLSVLATQPREIAVACASAIMRRRGWPAARLDAVFARSPLRCRAWQSLVSALDDSHGETFCRLWFLDAGIPFEQQPAVAGVGHLDFRVGPHTYVEIDGAQHDPNWVGESVSSWEHDHDRDTTMAIRGDRVLRYTYRQLYGDRPRMLASIERAIADGEALAARRKRHPYRPRASRKRRRSAEIWSQSRSHPT